MAVFQGCQIVLDLSTAVKFKEKQTLRKLVTDNAGVVSFIVTKKSTHVVCDDGEKADTSYKCRMAIKYGIPVISTEFLWRSVETGVLQKTDDFIVAGKSKSDTLKEGKISASKYQKIDKKKAVKPFINVGGIKVWSPTDNDCPAFTADYQVAKFAVFKDQKKEKSRVVTSFTVIEVHVDENFIPNVNPELKHKYRVSSHTGVLHQLERGGVGKFEYRFCSNIEETLAVYTHLYNTQIQKGMDLVHGIFSRLVGSEKFKQMMSELGLENTKLTESVEELIQHVWSEAQGEIHDVVSGINLTVEQVDKAEAILKQIKSALDEDDQTKLGKLLSEFYSTIPHHATKRVTTCSKKWLSRSQDLCQLIRDMLTVSEATDWSQSSSVQSKYKALRCVIENLSTTCPEFIQVQQMVMQSLTGSTKPAIKSIFAVSRPVENVAFTDHIAPKQLLFHSTKAENLVGILSRGLLLPRVVVDDHGGKRTDPGMLGAGIYFADSASTSVQYSHPSDVKGTRFMLVNEVALGRTLDMYKKDLTLTLAPEGYHSVHGVKSSGGSTSEFKDDEYVVYNTNQQRIKYLVEFVLPEDKIKYMADPNLSDVTDDMSDVDLDAGEISLTDVTNIADPLSKVKPGLVSKSDAPVNLKAVHIRAKLLDLASEVVVLQEYENTSKSPLETKYVFPLGDLAAVCGFEAFINGKHIVGEVQEKEKAHKEYKKAISEGHGAYLMDQDEETPDIFTVSVGNLPPGACVLIKITYVAELQVEGEQINFQLPGSVAPWKKQSLKEVTQHETQTHEVEQGETSVQIAVDMPFDIRTIECPSHQIKVKKTMTKATVEMLENQSISDGFQLLIGLAEIHVPRMWVERKAGDQSHQACMLSFYPEFEACETEDVDVVLLLDVSNSMKGYNLNNTKKIALLTLQQLPPLWNFNIVVFGTAFKEVFPGCVKKTPANIKTANQFIMNLTATMGNTEVVRPMHTFYLLKPDSMIQNVFLISDGHINNEETMMTQALNNFHHTRIFTLGVGSTANRHLLRALARVGGGAYEFFDQKAKSKWERKIKSQISKAAQPGLTSVSVDWEQHGADVPGPVQAPRLITALFSGSRQVIYGYVPNCTMATLRANIAGEEVSTLVSTSDLSITTGKILHRLTAKAIISDWEDGVLSPDKTDHELMKMTTKDYIIELSKEYSIVTQFTSFVAIEKRDKDDEKAAIDAPSMYELVEKESVDELTYMGFEEAMETEVDINKSIEEVLTNIRLNFVSKDKQLEFLHEGFKLLEQIMDEEDCSQKKSQLEDAFFDWDLSEQFNFAEEFGYKPKRQLVALGIRTLTGKIITIHAEPTSTIWQLKTLIKEQEGKPQDAQRLIFEGRQTEDSKTLAELGIDSTSKIHLLERLRGGGTGPAIPVKEKDQDGSVDLFMDDYGDDDNDDDDEEDSEDWSEASSSSEYEEEDGEQIRMFAHEISDALSAPVGIPFACDDGEGPDLEAELDDLMGQQLYSSMGAHALSAPVDASYASDDSDLEAELDDLMAEVDNQIIMERRAIEPEIMEMGSYAECADESVDADQQMAEEEESDEEPFREISRLISRGPYWCAGESLNADQPIAEEEESEEEMRFGLFDDDYIEETKLVGLKKMASELEEELLEQSPMVDRLDECLQVERASRVSMSIEQEEASRKSPVAYDEEIQKTREILSRNVEKVLERGEMLDELVEKSEELSTSGAVFYKSASKLSENLNGGGGKKKKKKAMLFGGPLGTDEAERKKAPTSGIEPQSEGYMNRKMSSNAKESARDAPPQADKTIFHAKKVGYTRSRPSRPDPFPIEFSAAAGRYSVADPFSRESSDKDIYDDPEPDFDDDMSSRGSPASPSLKLRDSSTYVPVQNRAYPLPATGPPPPPPKSVGEAPSGLFGTPSFHARGPPAPPPPPPPKSKRGAPPVLFGAPSLPASGPPPPPQASGLFISAPLPPPPSTGGGPSLLFGASSLPAFGPPRVAVSARGPPPPPPPIGGGPPVLFGAPTSILDPEARPFQPYSFGGLGGISGAPPAPPPPPSAPIPPSLDLFGAPPPPPSAPIPPSLDIFGAPPPPPQPAPFAKLSLRKAKAKPPTSSMVQTPKEKSEKPRFTDSRDLDTTSGTSPLRKMEAKLRKAHPTVSWRSAGPIDKGYEGREPSRRGALLSSIKQGKQLKQVEAPEVKEAQTCSMDIRLRRRMAKKILAPLDDDLRLPNLPDQDVQTALLDDFDADMCMEADKINKHGIAVEGEVELSSYGIGVDIPHICTGTLDTNKKEEFMSWIISAQSKEGFWEIKPGSQLEKTLKVDITVVEQVLKRAGLLSLGMSVYSDITRLVSTIIVVLSLIKLYLPERVPMDFNDSSIGEQFLKDLLKAVGNASYESIEKAFKYGVEVEKRRTLVCNTLELGPYWILFVARMMELHKDGKIVSETMSEPYNTQKNTVPSIKVV